MLGEVFVFSGVGQPGVPAGEVKNFLASAKPIIAP